MTRLACLLALSLSLAAAGHQGAVGVDVDLARIEGQRRLSSVEALALRHRGDEGAAAELDPGDALEEADQHDRHQRNGDDQQQPAPERGPAAV